MKRTLDQIRKKIFSVAHELRENAAYAGERGDGGAARLENELIMFADGYKACLDAYIEETNHILDTDAEITVPNPWRKYFIEEDKEYQDYLRLKEKYENEKQFKERY